MAVLVATSLRAATYELTFNPNYGEENASAFYFAPVNSEAWAFCFPGSRIAYVRMDPHGGGRLYSPHRECRGRINGKNSELTIDKGLLKGDTFRFREGALVSMRGQGTDEDKTKMRQNLLSPVRRKRDLSTLWRPKSAKHAAQDGWDYWRESGRLRLWFFNPNGAGTLFAEIALLGFALAIVARSKWTRILWGGIVLASGAGLLATGSRGSLLALGAGLSVVAYAPLVHGRRFTRKHLLVGAAITVSAAGCLLYLGMTSGRNGFFTIDEGNRIRLNAWKAAPAMMAAAPEGWGRDRSGAAYCNWFQPEDGDARLMWLANSHLTWMVESGNAFRFLYLCVWLSVLIFLGWLAKKTKLSFALGEGVLFAIAMWFSTVGVFASLWAIPLGAMIAAPIAARREIPLRRLAKAWCLCCMCAATGAAITQAGLLAVGRAAQKKHPRIVRRTGVVQVGEGEPRVWMSHDDFVLTGGYAGPFGKEIRRFFATHPNAPAIGIVDSIQDLPPSADCIVLAGEAGTDYLKLQPHRAKEEASCHSDKVIFLSPPFPPTALPKVLTRQGRAHIFTGYLAARLCPAYDFAPEWVTIVPDAELYIPNWLDIVFWQTKQEAKEQT